MKENTQAIDSMSNRIESEGTETEGGRRPNGVSVPPAARDPEHPPRSKRRYFTAAYKARILDAADLCEESGEIGALLRREGLYSSNLAQWRRERRKGTLTALSSRKRGRKGPSSEEKESREEVQRLRKENARLQKRLEYAELLLDIQKKASEILGIPLKGLEDDENDS